MVFLASQSLAAAPTRPPKVPDNTVWAGGLDGGAWIRCDRISKEPWGPVFKCTTYNDQTGEVWSRGLYVVGYFENQTFHRVQRYDGKPRYTSFDGEVIHIESKNLLMVPHGEIDYPVANGGGKRINYDYGKKEGLNSPTERPVQQTAPADR